MNNLRRIIFFGCLLLAGDVSGEGWRFPESKSVRIDTKVHFVDDQQHTASSSARDNNNKHAHATPQEDEIPFKEPTNTEGFYNRPPGAGRYPVRVEEPRSRYRVNPHAIVPVTSLGYRRLSAPPPPNDAAGTLDAFKYCKCVGTPDCNPIPDTNHACGPGEYLCCFKKPIRGNFVNSEFFNEEEDERPILYPNREIANGAFPPPPGVEFHGVFGNSAHEAVVMGAADQAKRTEALVGPGGPTGHIGPKKPPIANNPPILVGPGGPTGMIGPTRNEKDTNSGATAQLGVLVGPGGPTGIIGPNRGLLVGPGGPTGMIGPNRGVLVGPGGPTGIIGPSYNRQSNPGILVGPGGPTGIIGPGRQLLVGPGGPTGYIGPRRPYAFSGLSNKAAINSAIRNIEKKDITRQVKTSSVQRTTGYECKNKRESRCVGKKKRGKRNTIERNWTMKHSETRAPNKMRKPRGIISDFIIPKFIKKENPKTEPTGSKVFNDKNYRRLEADKNTINTETDHKIKETTPDSDTKKQTSLSTKHEASTKYEESTKHEVSTKYEASAKTRQKRGIITNLLFPKIFKNMEKKKENKIRTLTFGLALLQLFVSFY